jgi:uncharacterized protein YajQ (UPF0234 family)
MISGKNLPNSEAVNEGKMVIAEFEVQSIVPTLMRHIIKRYLKKAGLKNVNVTHKLGSTPFTMKLVIEAESAKSLSKEQKNKINRLVSSIEFVLEKVNGRGAEADPEELRSMLANEEPSLRKIYYKVK